MPRKYEAIRDRMKRQGKSDKEAKTRAAKIYNATRTPGSAPVTRNYEKTKAKRAAKKAKR